MATEAILTPGSRRYPRYRPVPRVVERAFFTGMAVLLCVSVFVGFSPSYYRADRVHASLLSPILHIHGAVFTVWMLLFIVQTALISARRVQWHRSLGIFAFCLPPVMVVLGMIAAIDALRRGTRIGPLDPATSLAIPLLGIITFAVVIFASWRARRRPDAHKRLILIATICLVGAAFGRFPWRVVGVPAAAGPATGIGVMLLLLLVYELIAIRRIHRSTMWAAPLAFASILFAVPIGMTAAWHTFAALLH